MVEIAGHRARALGQVAALLGMSLDTLSQCGPSLIAHG
jgi:hypothetical protein